MTRRQPTLLRLGLLSALVLVGAAWWLFDVHGSPASVGAPEAVDEREPPRTFIAAEPVKRVPERHVVEIEEPIYAPCDGRPAQVGTAPLELPWQLVRKARKFFDLGKESSAGIEDFRDELQLIVKRERIQILAHPPTLRRLVTRARSFGPPLHGSRRYRHRREARRQWAIGEAPQQGRDTLVFHGEYGVEITRDDTPWLHLFVPEEHEQFRRSFLRHEGEDPWPALLVLHDRSDLNEDPWLGAGARCLQRLWARGMPRHGPKQWIALVPLTAMGTYSEDGMIRDAMTLEPLRLLWNHYHVDFDRIVVDGGADVLTLLGSSPGLFAGAVVRGGALATPKLRASVANYEHVPLYVVGDVRLAEALKAAGHPDVTFTFEGNERELSAWLTKQRRCLPRSFSWHAVTADQALAWWVNIDKADWSPDVRRFLRVRCIDSKRNPNTVFVQCEGIHELTFFLNDDLVDLDRPVRIVINNRLVRTETLKVPAKDAGLSRTL